MTSKEERNTNKRILPAISIIALMLLSTQLSILTESGESSQERTRTDDTPKRTAYQQLEQLGGPVQGESQGQPATTSPSQAAAFHDPFYNDPAAIYGKVSDTSALTLDPSYGFFLEETNTDDHDNDGIDDLNDLDDDNDGINDLIERFDGCYGTDPLDHDNDGVRDEFDWDDDNDGILEGPVDYSQGNDPWNVSTDRHVEPTTIHPWTGQAVGFNYLVDQNPMDHDNDGITDEDIDGSGRGSYDEDDDNDGRIDQFVWPCDFDSDGIQDYFDLDDDNDGVDDIDDIHPWDSTQTSLITSDSDILWDDWQRWDPEDYGEYVDGLDYVALHALEHPRQQAFTEIVDGDLDGDGIPNFLDPDNDNDGAPDSSDTDDDNDGLADMYDVDDDNDGIPDSCRQLDTNGDGQGDYPTQAFNGSVVDILTPGTDCEIDYDGDLDDDRFRAIDADYDLVWDWLDTDMGGSEIPDNLMGGSQPWDLDDDGLENEVDPYPLNSSAEVATWDCASVSNPNPQNPSDKCVLWRTSYTGFNDWDGDGLNNWVDMDDDGDGILDWLDIDPDCDLDNDADLHELNGSKYRDDGANDIDTDVDGDGLANDEDWDDDNDGINDFYDPDDGNCGIVDTDNTDNFWGNSWPQSDGDAIDGSEDSDIYAAIPNFYWNLTWGFNPFNEDNGFMLDYNGYDPTSLDTISGVIPEMYWFLMMKWSPYNGGNFFDIDDDGDSLVNGIDVDQDGDGMPDWWDQDEGNDGVLDVNDVKMGGTLDGNSCGTVIHPSLSGIQERWCGHLYGYAFMAPLLTPTQSGGQSFTVPYSTRPDAEWDDGAYDGTNHPTGMGSCDNNCFWFTFDPTSNPSPSVAYNYQDIKNNRDLWIAYLGVTQFGFFQWTSDNNGNFFPDEIADNLNDDVDPDIDCGQPMPEVSWTPNCMYNNTNDLDDDWDIVYDHFDVDDDNDGIWDYFEVDSNDDLDDDATIEEPYYFTGSNCEDNDDDGLDTDPDDDGIYQAVWDRGVLGQSLLFPQYYDVDNDNDGIPDGEDPDDDNNGLLDETQEAFPGCFTGEEQSTWDHDNDGIVNWADDDWDGDGIPNHLELQNLNDTNGTVDPFDDTCCLNFPIAPWDHDNDGIRDDLDDDDDFDGMKDEDEVMLWPSRYGSESTNPWDHDDFGGGVGLADPSNNSTGPDYFDVDDDNDGREDADWNNPTSGDWPTPANKIEEASGLSSDWDSDNDGVLDPDDKIPTRITLNTQSVLWLDETTPAIFNGSVFWLDDTGFVPAPDLPVQVHIRYTENGTSVIETIDVLTNANGEYVVGQFLFPEDIDVGPNTTYEVYSEVTEMFIHDYSSTLTDSDGDGFGDAGFPVEVRANTTIGFVSGQRFRADEQPLKLDFKVHYTADYNRGIFDNRLAFAPVSFTISDPGTQFGNITEPTVYDGYGNGYRADSGGWVSLAYNQSVDVWEQVQWNSLLDNGPGIPTGGYEEIVWNPCTQLNPVGSHSVLASYEYKNTTLPTGDYSFIGYARPDLGGCTDDSYEWPWSHLEGSKTDTFFIRAMHRMYIEADMFAPSFRPVYFWDATQFTGSSFGAWRALFHAPSLANAGISFEDASLGKSYPILWDGTPASLSGIAAGALTPFLSANGTHWTITLQNGADFDSPPCGPVDPLVASSEVRCEIVPEVFTGEEIRVIGHVWNRTFEPAYMVNGQPIRVALQFDFDQNGMFVGSIETQHNLPPSPVEGLATFDYDFEWESQYQAGTYGVRADFAQSDYFFTGDQDQVLAATGAYGNVSVIGTTEFRELNSLPQLYRGQNTSVQVRLVDNARQPVREVPVNWTWSEDQSSGVSITDNNGRFRVNLTDIENLGNYTLGFTYLGDERRQGNHAEVSLWVVSRTYINVQSTSPNIRSNGDLWEFTAVVTDDNRTPFEKDGGQVLNSCAGEMKGPNGNDLGGNVTVIFEGIDFEDRTHRQIVSVECPASGSIGYGRYLDPQLLKDDPFSFLPDGFGPVNVILRFEHNLPHEGCEPLDSGMLSTSGAWDPCVNILNSDHYRKVLQFQVDGFSLIGNTELDVDQQIVYTSEIDPDTGRILEKPMLVTGQLTDELGGNLSNRQIRVTFEMGSMIFDPIENRMKFRAGDTGIEACIPGATDENGFFDINCPLAGVDAGMAKVKVEYNSWDPLNNDRYRYKNKTQTMFFPVFSNSTIDVSEVGPFRSDYLTYTFPNGSTFDVLYLKEAFHINAKLSQSNGKPVGGKCVNIYLDPEVNTRPIATAFTSDGTGEFVWYSANPDDNPSRRGVEPSGNNLEGFRTVRVAYEPEKYVPGGCDYESLEPNPVLNSSIVDVEVLVRSKVDILLKEHWSSPIGYQEGDIIAGEVAILRDRLDLTVEGQRVEFHRQFWNGSGWQTERVEIFITNERGSANFSFPYTGELIPGQPEWSAPGGKWRVLVHFESADANKPYFVEKWLNSTPEIKLGEPPSSSSAGLWSTQILLLVGISLSTVTLVGAMMYNNYRERRKVEVLRGILTDALMSLKASNNYIEAIFSCYKDLIKYFRMKGAMKKVFETTREFEDVINNMLGGIIPPEEIDMFFSIFEEARYSDHEIGSEERDRAIHIFQSMIGRMNSSLGDSMLNRASVAESSLYGPSVKAGQFVDAEGNVRFAGIDDAEEDDGFRI